MFVKISPRVSALIRTSGGRAPSANFQPADLGANPLRVESLLGSEEICLPGKKPDGILDLILTGRMSP